MQVRYKDLSVHDVEMKKELLEAVDKVLSHGKILLGPEVGEFEKLVAERTGTKYAVGVGCGTDALFLSLKALGIGQGDEVITTPLSWIATANAIVATGAKPVFVDIGLDLNIDANLIENAITKNTKAIMPVHFTGRLCKMEKILQVAKKNKLFVIEDSAQAYGSHLNGKMAGSFGDTGCFSMNAMKNFSAYGEAGAIVLNDEKLKDDLVSLRYNGTINKEDCHVPSVNARIDTLHASLMNVNAKYLTKKIDRIRQISQYYNDKLSGIVDCPLEDESYHTYYSYTIKVPRRTHFINYLTEHGIESKIQHPILQPFHTAYKNIHNQLYIPVAISLVNMIVCIPNHEKLTDSQVEFVVDKIKDYDKFSPLRKKELND